jgi:high-affinity iron transporter
MWAIITSLFVIIAFAVLILQYSKRLPIKQIFRISAITMVVLAVVLVGKGFSALQEAGAIEMNLLSDWIRFEPLGIYPTMQSVGAQLLTLILTIGIWVYMERPRQILSTVKSDE